MKTFFTYIFFKFMMVGFILYACIAQGICTIEGLAGKLPDKVCFLCSFAQFKDAYNKNEICNKFIFVGPPGTGKTTVIEKIANKSKAHVIHLSGASIVNQWQNGGAQEIKKKYKEAIELANKGYLVIVFIDEADAVSKNERSSMHEAYKNACLELVQQISAHKNNRNIITVLATNDFANLDKALISRAEMVEWDLPDIVQREAILRFYANECKTDFKDSEFYYFAKKTKNFSGRDLEDLIRTVRSKVKQELIGPDNKNSINKDTVITLRKKDIIDAINSTKQKQAKEKQTKEEQENKQYKLQHQYGTDKIQAFNQWGQAITLSCIFAYWGSPVIYKYLAEKKPIVRSITETIAERTGQQVTKFAIDGKDVYPDQLTKEQKERIVNLLFKNRSEFENIRLENE